MGIWRWTCFSLLLGVFLSSFSELTGGTELNVAAEQGTSIHINTSAGVDAQCEDCISQVCQSSVVLKSETRLNCSQPENVFTLEIAQDAVINIEAKEHDAFQKFDRTFTWNLKKQETETRRILLNFSSTGLRQIGPTDGCPDKHVYMITMENVTIGRFCQNGAIKKVEVRNVGKLSLEVSGGQPLNMTVISVSMGYSTNTLARIYVDLPEMSSTHDFFTPNTFPEDAGTVWDFSVPETYYTSVHIRNHTVPTCLQPKNIPKMFYFWLLRKILKKTLNGTQPSEEAGSFQLFIKNCNMSRPSQDLMVHFQISTIERIKGQCMGDLPENQMLQIHVKKKRISSSCSLRLDSVRIYHNVTIASGKRYVIETFDCDDDELEWTVTQTIGCKEWRKCASTLLLDFKYKLHCVGVLKKMTWHLHGPQNSAVELQSPTGLRYCSPEDKSNSIFLLDVSHINPGITVGQFCPNGTIEKIQIRESSITVTASVTSFNTWNLATKLLTYSFTQNISEHYIFTVAPQMDNPTVLATPAWPSGMKPSSTVSWIINTEIKSNLKFRNVSQPKCEEVHTNIAVQTIRSQKMLYSTKEDEKINDVLVPESFYLNMTNCKSPKGAFRAMMEITLQNNTNTNKLLGIILSIVGIVLLIITAVAIWIVLRKKKRNKAPPVTVYNPNAFLPGLHGIPKTQEGEDPYTYTYIDDTLVYSHLLKRNAENEQCTDESSPPLPDRPLRKSVTDSEMVDNELYGNILGESTISGSPKSPIKTSE